MESGAFRVGDDIDLDTLQSDGEIAISARPAPPSDPGLAPGVAGAGGQGARGDVGAGDGGSGLHDGDVIGGETSALVIVGVLKEMTTNKITLVETYFMRMKRIGRRNYKKSNNLEIKNE
jgi:hypothetical protein